MHKSNQLFKYHDVYNNKQLFKLIEYSTQINGLIYYNINDLPKSITNFIK